MPRRPEAEQGRTYRLQATHTNRIGHIGLPSWIRMASYHLSVKVFGRSGGKSAPAAAAYRARTALTDNRQGLSFDYSAKQDLGFSVIMAPDHAPAWVYDRSSLWNAVEASEKRKDSQVAREVEIALPKELTLEQNIELLKEFTQKNFVDLGMIADVNIHNNEKNPHAHIMLTTREITPDGFGKKNTDWNKRENVLIWREGWANLQNIHLQQAGFDIQVDHRSHADRGIDLEPQIHLGPDQKAESDEKRKPDRIEEYRRIARENGERIIADPSIALDVLTRHQGIFTHLEIDKFAHSHSVDEKQFFKVVRAIEESSSLLRIGDNENGVLCYTTKEMIQAEKEMLTAAHEMKNANYRFSDSKKVEPVLATRTLTQEQEKVFRDIMYGPPLSLVIGKAGTGKSYTLDAVREAYEAQGFTVRGAALSGIAAEGLQNSSGIESRTIHSLLNQLDQGREQLNKNHVLIVDEAGMVGTRQMHRIVQYAHDADARLILVGDVDQLQPIEAGGPFRGLVGRHYSSELQTIMRQKQDWQKQATHELSNMVNNYEFKKGLDRYAQAGQIHGYKSFDSAKAGLIQEWSQYQKENYGKSSLILAHRRADVSELNLAAREELKKTGLISSKEYEIETARGDRMFAQGERIMFLRNENSMGVKNGSLGTVTAFGSGGGSMTVRMDDGRALAFDTHMYNNFDHGYAATIHKTQGVTVDRTFILGTYGLDRQLVYVAFSRHRENVSLHAGVGKGKDEFRDYKHMREVFLKSREKGLVLDYAHFRGVFDTDKALYPKLNPAEYAVSKGYAVDKNMSYPNSLVLDGKDDKILVSRDKEGNYSYTSLNGKGTGSIVELHQAVTGQNPAQAREAVQTWLVQKSEPAITIPNINSYIGREEAFKQLHSAHAIDPENPYLEGKGIFKKTLQDVRFKYVVFQDENKNVLYAFRDREGLTGFEERNTTHTRYSSDVHGVWESFKRPGDTQLVITDTPLQALSYHQLHGDENTRYLAVSTGINTKAQKEMIRERISGMPEGSDIVIATGHGERNERIAGGLERLYAEVKRDDLTIKREKPKDDFNLDLREKLSELELKFPGLSKERGLELGKNPRNLPGLSL